MDWMSSVDLKPHGILVEDTRRNLTPSQLYEKAIRHEAWTCIADSGCWWLNSGSRRDARPGTNASCRRPESERDVWWGAVNVPLEPHNQAGRNAGRAARTGTTAFCLDGSSVRTSKALGKHFRHAPRVALIGEAHNGTSFCLDRTANQERSLATNHRSFALPTRATPISPLKKVSGPLRCRGVQTPFSTGCYTPKVLAGSSRF